jgi:hypothetical protein
VEETIDSFMEAISFHGSASFHHGDKDIKIPFYYQ